MTARHAAPRLATASLVLFGVSIPAEADNANFNFVRMTLGIGVVANKLAIAGSGNNGMAEAVAIEASKQLDPKPEQELHAYNVAFGANGHSNWHSHPGLELAIHTGDSTAPLTFYLLNRNGTCRRQVLSPGQSLVVLPNETHMARNETVEDTWIIVERIHPGNSQTLPVTRDEPQPQGITCPQI